MTVEPALQPRTLNVFELRQALVRDYSAYMRSFLQIHDPRIRDLVNEALEQGLLWPEPLIQMNPAFEPGAWVDELVDRDWLHPECRRIFRKNKTADAPEGSPLLLHRHQVEAIEAARAQDHY
ncbi:MAG TPA: hypothetical protein VNO81_08270, partial [Candidatus Nitrosotenuis sp.]|nr:hypothetical protein [Candidatus Nitrosotenuis sp.]